MQRTSVEKKRQDEYDEYDENEEFIVQKKKKILGKQEGNWTEAENMKYAEYLKMNFGLMHDKLGRRTKKIFERMSRLIKTRCPTQCRSHHQKCMKKYQSMERIV